ncbi:MAG: ATPase [Bacteroidales bacterium]|jgi:N-acetylglucosamine kinase-like BadF-type ATPase|nr:ATPase [Bacteroidales bacterium]
MILIADSGSTKTEWREIEGGKAGRSYISSGINPFFISSDEIVRLLGRELPELKDAGISQVFFYGTGVSNPAKAEIVRGALASFFGTGALFIGSDLLGAARSLCQDEPGIACIIGTGSNSCYYDGKNIVSNVSPLGYILGDEGGGAVIGRKLVAGVLKKQLPGIVIENFFKTYPYTPAEILDNVYNMPLPNRFLGQFSRFISDNIHVPELQAIITSSFDEFITRNVLSYPEARKYPIHFTGSIAFHFRPFLEDLLRKHRLQPGIFTLTPMENLVRYHIQNSHFQENE